MRFLRDIIIRPLEGFLFIAWIVDLLDIILHKLGITFLGNIAFFMRIDSIGKIVGFSGGISPFSSYENAMLYLGVMILSGALILPIVFYSKKQQDIANGKESVTAIRLRTGKILQSLSDYTGIILLLIAFLTVIDLISIPFYPAIKWLVLAGLGIVLSVDSLSLSQRRHQYGLENKGDKFLSTLFSRLGRRNKRFVTVYKEITERDQDDLDRE